jgi:hypothetical protein
MKIRRGVEDWAYSLAAGFASRARGRRAQRGQSRAESVAALAVLIVAFAGAWLLYKDSIVETARALIGYFFTRPEGS